MGLILNHIVKGTDVTRTNSLIFAALLIATCPAHAQDSTAAKFDGVLELLIGLSTFIVVGAVVGWAAGRAIGGSGMGLRGDVLFGIGGSILASYLATEMSIWAGGVLGALLAATIGALMLILIVRLIRTIRL